MPKCDDCKKTVKSYTQRTSSSHKNGKRGDKVDTHKDYLLCESCWQKRRAARKQRDASKHSGTDTGAHGSQRTESDSSSSSSSSSSSDRRFSSDESALDSIGSIAFSDLSSSSSGGSSSSDSRSKRRAQRKEKRRAKKEKHASSSSSSSSSSSDSSRVPTESSKHTSNKHTSSRVPTESSKRASKRHEHASPLVSEFCEQCLHASHSKSRSQPDGSESSASQ